MSKAVVKVEKLLVPAVDTRVALHMLTLRGERVLLDIHLSELYDVETRVLKQAVRRNKHRFPSDFMFTLKVLEGKYVRQFNEVYELIHQLLDPPELPRKRIGFLLKDQNGWVYHNW
jgi:hypothetical protein